MREVLISIQPKWVKKICHKIGEENGKPIYEKRAEVRKTRPKCELPFKGYIYCTKGKPTFTQSAFCDDISNGKVIGEFVCDRIDEFSVPYPAYFGEIDSNTESIIKSACLKPMDIHAYNGTHQTYGWHISDLKIYDEPRELSEFRKDVKDRCTFNEDGVCLDRNQNHVILCDHMDCCQKEIKRPPQSWCYCEKEDTK